MAYLNQYSSLSETIGSISMEDLVSVTDDENTGVLHEDRFDQSGIDADALINGFVGGRHSVPFSPIPALVKKFAIDIRIYNIYSRRQGPPDYVIKKHDDAILFLKGVRDGVNSLGVDDPFGTPAESNTVEFSSSVPIFTRETMRGF